MNRFLNNIISFFSAAFFVILGGFLVFLAWSSLLLNATLLFLQEQPLLIFFFGISLFLIGIGLSIHLYLMSKHYSYRIISAPHPVEIDQKLIEHALSLYLKELFPKEAVAYQINFSKNKFYIEADLPPFAEEEQENIIKRMEQELAVLFHKTIGYDREYQVSLNFQVEKAKEL